MTAIVCLAVVPPAEAVFTSGRSLTIDASQVSGSGGSIASYPVAVQLTDKDLRTVGNGGKVTSANGYDIVFRAYDTATCGGPASCTLDHEVETYDGVAGSLVAWVSIPSLSQDTDTVFTMHYGDASIVAPTENPTGVWDGNFGGVWHLDEDPLAAPPQFIDSTSNPNDGTSSAPNPPLQLAGKLNGGSGFDLSNGRHVDVADHASLQLATNMTVLAWVSTTSMAIWARAIVTRWDDIGIAKNYYLGKVSDTAFNFDVDANTEGVSVGLGLIDDGAWHQVVGVADAGAGLLRLYVDGTQINTSPYDGTSEVGTSNIFIGESSDVPGQEWDGSIDEVRISSIPRSPDWIRTSYNNQSAPHPFYRPTVNLRSIGSNAANLHTGGTVSINAGSTTVTLTNPLAAFDSVGAVGPGDELDIAGEVFYIVNRVSDTEVTVDHAARPTISAKPSTR